MKTKHMHWMTMLTLVFVLTGCPFNSDNNPTDNTPAPQVLTTQEKAIAKIESYASSNGSSSVPTLQDYVDAGVTGLNASELADINEVVENLVAEEVDTPSEIQALADALGINIDTTVPVFTSSGTASVNENQTSAITLVATDNSTVTYSISGTDASSFSVDVSTGVVTFHTAPDFETKNDYAFTATAIDEATNSTNQAVTITILDVDETPVPITHNGTTYGTVTSPYTGKVWLDKNLGASHICTSVTDSACYGDYYQWGRNFDGHENRTSTTTNIQATDVHNVGNVFITATGINLFDWGQVADSSGSLRLSNWAKTDGTSVCPIGFKVPTFIEISAELLDVGTAEIANSADAFNSFLKLPSNGSRTPEDGIYINGNPITKVFVGSIWSNAINDGVVNDHRMKSPFWSSGFIGVSTRAYRRSSGRAVRCIKD